MVAGDLADIYTFYVYLDGSLDSTITYSPMVYFYNVVSGNNYPQELVNLVKSMYIYAATYDGYFG